MKTKLTIGLGVMTAALFLLVTSATPKGHGGGGGGTGGALLPLSTLCNTVTGSIDHCAVTITPVASLTAAQYRLEVVDTGCSPITGGVIYANSYSGSALATAGGIVSFDVDDGGCGTGSWTVNLYASSRTKGSFSSGVLVSSGPATDTD